MSISSVQPVDNMRSFVEADPVKVANRSYRKYQVAHREDTKKFDKGISNGIKTLPFIAAASTFLLTKSAKSAAKSGAIWGAAVLAPALVSKANNVVAKNVPGVKKAEKKHSGLTLAGLVFASFAAIEGGIRGVDKLAKNSTVKKVFSAVADSSKDLIGKLRPEINKVIPNKVANMAGKVAEKLMQTPKNPVVRQALANAPAIAGLGLLGVVVGKAVSDVSKYSQMKKEIKTAQFETAKNLVNMYSEENEQLKAENECLKAQFAEDTEV